MNEKLSRLHWMNKHLLHLYILYDILSAILFYLFYQRL